jgi:hypothetical protein
LTGDTDESGCLIVLQWQNRGGWVRILEHTACYDRYMFNFGKPKTIGDWVVHIAGAIVAIFLIWWMLRVYVL